MLWIRVVKIQPKTWLLLRWQLFTLGLTSVYFLPELPFHLGMTLTVARRP
jgi:hypothetical protein